MRVDVTLFASALAFCTTSAAELFCKNHPSSTHWPSAGEWDALNHTVGGGLIRSTPVASSCYKDSNFASAFSCKNVTESWFLSEFHALQPESIGYSYWANNSCVPPNDHGYRSGQSCKIGGLPQYVLEATSAAQIATAMKWASSRNIRIVIKGTGHDLNGRSSGAYSLSIWTHRLRDMSFQSDWPHPFKSITEHVAVVGSGNNWGDVLQGAYSVGRTVVSGQDPTVGLGGFIGGGGHGPLSSHHGLAADQVLQATVVTTDGRILVANPALNQDLLWAIRGGGPGLYGVVVEYVLRTHPYPKNVVWSSISIDLAENATVEAATASWKAMAVLVRSLPGLMDLGITGNGFASTSTISTRDSHSSVQRGVGLKITLFGYNTTTLALKSLLEPTSRRMMTYADVEGLKVTMTEPKMESDYLTFFDVLNPNPSACSDISLVSSRLLGHSQLTDLSLADVQTHLYTIMNSQVEGEPSNMIIGLQGGPGPRDVSHDMRGGLNPAWRQAYLHLLSTGVKLNVTNPNIQGELRVAAEWIEEHKEVVWRKWAPGSGSYINEANPFNGNFKEDFYGASYDRLVEIKQKYDPTDSLYVLSGVGSDKWQYDLNSGMLCAED
ncbi:hypothetical protein FOVSG1_010705 [Fusarium oxysporum f. sp. vasinfectum]